MTFSHDGLPDRMISGLGGELREVWDVIRSMLALPEPSKGKVGFRKDDK